ncbi:Mismatch repair protein msh3 [Chytriomyces hyalinus]|nr:Mismatch repair protein msh3 [Chytriomyces hyalinus]
MQTMLGKTKKAKTVASTGKKQATISSFFAVKDKSPASGPAPCQPKPVSSEPIQTPSTTPVCPAIHQPPLSNAFQPSISHETANPAHTQTNPTSENTLKRRRVISDDSDEDSGDSAAHIHSPRISLADRFSVASGLSLNSAAQISDETRERFRKRFLLKNPFNRVENVDTTNDMNEDEDVAADTPSTSVLTKSIGKSTPKSTSKKSSSAIKYTPLEQQYLQLRKQYPDVLMAVEVGYKFRFFEEDALSASKELNIVAYMDKNLRGASIPTHRLYIHVSKLVHLGYKVGIVRQSETAALKAAGDNKSAPFTRTMTNIFTKSTFIDPDLCGSSVSAEIEAAEKSSYLMVLSETFSASTEKCKIHMVAVQLSTGEIVYDSFEDGALRGELETRLEHVRPVELVLPVDGLSPATEGVLKHWAVNREQNGDCVRVERLKDAFVDVAAARSNLAEFYEKPIRTGRSNGSNRDAEMYLQLLSLPEDILVCLSALLHHLTEFNLDHALLLTKSFMPFRALGQMTLSGPTLRALEVFEPEEAAMGGGSVVGGKGSLLWVLDHTVTRFGARLLKRWVGRPLVNVQLLQERIDAVQEVIECIQMDNVPMIKLRGLLNQLPDLEKSLARIRYNRCPPSDLHATLSCLSKIATTLSLHPTSASPFKSSLLNTMFEQSASISLPIMGFLARLDAEACSKNVKRNVFVFLQDGDAESESMTSLQDLARQLRECEDGFVEILKGIRKRLKGGYAGVEFVSVAGTEYLIEIKVSNVGIVPKDWIKVNNTKAVSRFHTPEVLEQLQERDVLVEKLNAAAEAAYLEFLGEVGEYYQQFRAVVQSLAIADCLLSLAKVAMQPGYTKPEYTDECVMEVVGGRHPIVEMLIPDFVSNDVSLKEKDRCLLITGPNMGGKSSYIRQVALIAIMGQIGSYVPADSARLGIFDAIFTRMGAYDDITRGHSTFMKELTETSEILQRATRRSLCILDELGRGTSTHDGTAIAYATLRYLVERVGCCTLFVTHYPSLGAISKEILDAGGIEQDGPETIEEVGKVRCAHMGFIASDEMDGGGAVVTFLYKLTEGLASRSYGLNVARLAGLPHGILESAQRQSRRLEAVHERTRGGVGSVTDNVAQMNAILAKLRS